MGQFGTNKTGLFLVLFFLFPTLFGGAVENKKIAIAENEKLFVCEENGSVRPPSILLFNCHYGAGHKMATQGIQESLPDCVIRAVDIYDEPLGFLDLLREINPNWSAEQIYNESAKREYYLLLNFLGKVSPLTLLAQREKIEKALEAYIKREKPDMIVSCIPLVNPFLLATAKKLNLPLLVVTTDIDISSFCYGFGDKKEKVAWNQFRMTVPFSKESWFDKFGRSLPEEVKDCLTYGFGYPTRHSFSEVFDEATLDALRKQYFIQKDENVVLVMMGGNTASAALAYADLFLRLSNDEINHIVGKDNPRNKIRLLCLCGDLNQKANQKLASQLNALNHSFRCNDRVTIQASAGTPHIAELVSLPELTTVISKPGGSTVNEMIKKKMPMIYHISGIPLDWERGNMEYGMDHDLGRPFQMYLYRGDNCRKTLVQALSETFALRKRFLTDKSAVPEAQFDFTGNLRSAVREMLFLSKD